MAYKFINPYNFVPLSKEKAEAKQEERTLTGVISYSLLTKTPLFIPNTSNDHVIEQEEYEKREKKDEYHRSYEFFSYEDLSDSTQCKKVEELKKPVIPGSEIRGMIRSNYEILTNSCMSAIDDDKVLTRRNAEVFKPGLIKKTEDGYELFEAEDWLLRTDGENNLKIPENWKDDTEHNSRKCYKQTKLKEGQKVYVTQKKDRKKNCKPVVEKIQSKNIDDSMYKTGYVIKGEDGPDMTRKDGSVPKQQKHCCHIFILKSGSSPIKKRLNVELLDIILKEFEKNKVHEYKEYKEQWGEFKEQCVELKKSEEEKYFPVYYSTIDNNYYMLSPAAITREIFENRLSDIMGTHKTCTDKNALCPACTLFGTVQKTFSSASRIRFTDLHLSENLNNEDIYAKKVTLKELSSPKLSNVEFYLQKPRDAVFWTYDYYIDAKGKEHTENYKAQINGRKFYWHDLSVKPTAYGADVKTIRNTTIRPVNSGIQFKGKLYFNNISDRELNELIYILNCGEECAAIAEKTHGYKLGTGKPLGLGSVALQVDKVQTRKIVKDNDAKRIMIESSDYGTGNGLKIDEKIRTEFEKMTSFTALENEKKDGYHFSYPYVEDPQNNTKEENTVFKWFVYNHKGYNHKKKESTGMPNARSQLYFREHLAAMEPCLRNTGAERIFFSDSEMKSSSKNETHSIKPEGSVKQIKIIGHNSKKTKAFFEGGSLYFKDVIPDGHYVEIDKILPIGTWHNVKYTGKKNGYDNYEYLGKVEKKPKRK